MDRHLSMREDDIQTCPCAAPAETTSFSLDDSAMSTHTSIRAPCNRCAAAGTLNPGQSLEATHVYRLLAVWGALERRISVKAAGARGARGARGFGCCFVSASVCTASSTPSACTERRRWISALWRRDAGMVAVEIQCCETAEREGWCRAWHWGAGPQGGTTDVRWQHGWRRQSNLHHRFVSCDPCLALQFVCVHGCCVSLSWVFVRARLQTRKLRERSRREFKTGRKHNADKHVLTCRRGCA